MKTHKKPWTLFLIILCGYQATFFSFAQDLGWRELIERTNKESPKPDQTFYYGEEDLQFGDLWLPEGDGPHPVVIMIHGGCWLSSIPGVVLMELICDDLRNRGIAVWNLEYRRLGNKGGGYPGTFLDVARGADYIRKIATEYNLDMGKIISVGHSAGGHLALWLSGRNNINKESRVFIEDPLKLNAVLSLAGIGDLKQFREFGDLVCADGVVNKLIALEQREQENPFSDTSPIEILPENTPQVIIHGVYDPIVPPFLGYAYIQKTEERNKNVKLKIILNAGHFEVIAPWTEAWKEICREIEYFLPFN